MKIESKIKGGVIGHGIGDALGVPVEFKSRNVLKQNPVTGYLGYMCWNQPPGTFSDDSSMMFCTIESFINGYDLNDIANKFIKWYKEGYWGAHNKLFDIGGTTRRSLNRIIDGENPLYSGAFFENENGNGSLMRILPVAFFNLKQVNIEKRYVMVKEVSSITHGHFTSVFSCFIFTEYVRNLCIINDKIEAFYKMKKDVLDFSKKHQFDEKAILNFERILTLKISDITEDLLASTGYVLDTLECVFWCFLNSDSYSEAVLKAVNLGGDTDTIAAITGGLAGAYYGFANIPSQWISELARINDVEKLITEFCVLLEISL